MDPRRVGRGDPGRDMMGREFGGRSRSPPPPNMREGPRDGGRDLLRGDGWDGPRDARLAIGPRDMRHPPQRERDFGPAPRDLARDYGPGDGRGYGFRPDPRDMGRDDGWRDGPGPPPPHEQRRYLLCHRAFATNPQPLHHEP